MKNWTNRVSGRLTSSEKQKKKDVEVGGMGILGTMPLKCVMERRSSSWMIRVLSQKDELFSQKTFKLQLLLPILTS